MRASLQSNGLREEHHGNCDSKLIEPPQRRFNCLVEYNDDVPTPTVGTPAVSIGVHALWTNRQYPCAGYSRSNTFWGLEVDFYEHERNTA